MSLIPTPETARGSHRTPFVPAHNGRLAFFSATNPVSGIATPQWAGSPALPAAGTSAGQMGNATPPVVWFKRGPGTVVEIRPIVIHTSAAGDKQGQLRVFTASREPSEPNVYQFQAQHVCNCSVIGGTNALFDIPDHLDINTATYASICYAKTIAIADDKSLPPGVKVTGDYGQGPASIVFDAGGADWIGVAGAALDTSNATTLAGSAIAFSVRSW